MAGRGYDDGYAAVKSLAETIKSSVPIQEVIRSRGFEANRAGFIRCPFHSFGNERTPSLHVNAKKNRWKCFGCGKGGDAINFIMELEHRSFGEAVEILATEHGFGSPIAAGLKEAQSKAQSQATNAQIADAWKRELDRFYESLYRAIRVGYNALERRAPNEWTDGEALSVKERARLEYIADELEVCEQLCEKAHDNRAWKEFLQSTDGAIISDSCQKILETEPEEPKKEYPDFVPIAAEGNSAKDPEAGIYSASGWLRMHSGGKR